MHRPVIRSCALAIAGMLLAACAATPRPSELATADRMMLDQPSAQRAAKAAPQVFQLAQRYYQLAEDAFEDKEMERCAHFAVMAAIKFQTAQEHARRLSAQNRRSQAEQRLKTAQASLETDTRLNADTQKRIARIETILKLQHKLTQERSRSQTEREHMQEKLAAEQVLVAQARKEKEIMQLLAEAGNSIQSAELLDAKQHDPTNLNSARTFVDQARTALKEKRFTHAEDLARMASKKADLAIAQAKAAYAKKQRSMNLLEERKNLFQDANKLGTGVDGASVKQDQRGIVITMHEMFASGRTDVLPDRTYLLDRIANLAQKYKNYPLVVEGYTDSHGRPMDNLALSQARAQSVMDYLTQQKKLTFSRIKSAGYGESNPIADNSMREGRAKNRRIEVIFLYR